MEALFRRLQGQEVRIAALIQIAMCFMALVILMNLEARKLEKVRKRRFR